jgi:hypothetical protein
MSRRPIGGGERKVDMPDQPEPQPEETEEEANEAQNKPLGFAAQYPAKPGQTQYGTYQNPNK